MASRPEPVKRAVELTDFHAPWCIQCALQWAELEKLRVAAPGAFTIRRVDVEREPDVARAWGVRQIPTLIALKDDREMERWVGTLEPHELRLLAEKFCGAEPIDERMIENLDNGRQGLQ
jgi:thioredoxin-like negative regulator of GroEL